MKKRKITGDHCTRGQGEITGYFLPFFSFSPCPLTAAEDPLQLRAISAILVDGETGKIHEKRGGSFAGWRHVKMFGISGPPPSRGKYLRHTHRHLGLCLADLAKPPLFQCPPRKNTQYTVKELYEAAVIYSANGASIALVELLAGSEGDFVRLANEKAKELGLRNTTLVNSTGLDNSDLMGMHPASTSPEATNLMTAKDLALLAFHLLRDHPEVLTVSSIPRKTFREGTPDAVRMDNWNWMLPGLVYAYNGVDGLKTGYTAQPVIVLLPPPNGTGAASSP